ncbi:MAG: 4Fe-4S dicluster domain-containing protein [Candidatus Omnitrophica bacterium]|nr:4Fe-4S dicluster domain-containing protein [Candidatus Omnitrophota bacterium]
MKLKKILQKDVEKLLGEAAKKWQTYVPSKNDEGDTLFAILPKEKDELEKALQRVNLKDDWVAISPKEIFFPQVENMFSFDKERITEEIETSKKLIFGIRPCDLKGVLFADEFFKRNLEDIYYLSRIEDRLIVTIGCNTPPRKEACFCTSANTGPFAKEGFDLELVDAGNYYLVEVGSVKGEEFINLYSAFFEDAGDDEAEKLNSIESDAKEAINVKVDFDKALEIMKGDKDLTENYKRIGERCIYCGGCVYTCPSCTCFNVFDDKLGDNGVRRRNWDTCVFRGYTREASGHNPRDEKWTRTARRYEHKLKYDYSVTGTSGCIACGRCLSSCPVNIGMSKFIEEITTNKRNM